MQSATITVTPDADADIRENEPNTNTGSSTFMISGGLGVNGANQARRVVLQFDLNDQIPSGATITAASLMVSVVRIPPTPANSTFGLHRILQEWSEMDVTWINRLAETPWDTPGLGGVNDAAGTASSSVFVAGNGNYTFPTSASLVADVQHWVDNPGENFGWLLRSESEALFTARHFASREVGTGAPTLSIQFTTSSPALAVTTTNLPDGQVGMDYAHPLDATGGTPPYAWSLAPGSGPLPEGLMLSTNGIISGNPTEQGGFGLTVRVTDSAIATADRELTLMVAPPDVAEPALLSQPVLAGGEVTFQFEAAAQHSYTVESNSDLNFTNWLTLTNIAAQGVTGNVTVSDVASGEQRFYRVRSP